MDLTDTDIVKAGDERPARRDGTCFYCSRPIGQPHADGCVIVSKSVVVKLSFEVVVDVPRDWDRRLTEFHRNDGSYCSDNDVDLISAWLEANPDRCLCNCAKAELLRDATEEDHKHLPVLISQEKAP